MTAVVTRAGAPALFALALASCSLTYSANVVEDDPLEALPASNGIIALEPLPASNGIVGPSAALVTQAQLLLAELGYEPGFADGIVGPRTDDAIAQFQDDYGVPATALVSEVLVVQLRYVSCVRDGTYDAIVSAGTNGAAPADDCESLLHSVTIQAVARLPGASDFIETNEIVGVGLPTITVIEQVGDYGRLGYRGAESDEDDNAGSQDAAVASADGASDAGSSQSSKDDEPGDTADSPDDTGVDAPEPSSGGGNPDQGRGGGRGGRDDDDD